jgi:hypothetical protein
MKTLGRILIILAVFAAVMGITYLIVNASSSSTVANMPAFGRDSEGGSRFENEQSQFPNGERPEFPGERHEFGREGERTGGWVFGLTRNIGIITVIVVLVTLIRNFMRKRPAPVPAE